MKLFLTLLSALLLIACTSDKTSQNLYSTRDIGKSIRIKACTVVSARAVIIKEEHSGEQGEKLGFFAGNVAGRNNSDKPLAGFFGGLIGGAVGRQVSDALHEREGVEYTVILPNGEERQLVQDIADGESILTIGDSCRLQISGSSNRVLPANHFPDAIKRPTKVQFID